MPNKELINTLRGAKAFLSLGDECKTPYICSSIANYLSSVYGQGQIYTEGAEADRLREEAQTYIMQELSKLTEAVFFSYEAAAKVLGREENLDLQEARHLWLDQLIAELEQGAERS